MGRRRASDMGDEPWTRIGRCASGWIRTRPRSRWRWPSRDARARSASRARSPTSPRPCGSLIERLAEKHGRLRVCYEAGPCGYGLHRQITALGHDCTVVAPSLDPAQARRAGEDQPARRPHAGPPASRRRADRGVGARPDARGDARPGAGAHGRDGGGAAGPAAAPGLPAAPRPGVHRPQGVVAGAPALAGRAPLRAPGPADRAPGADRRHRRGRAPPRPPGGADPGAGAGLVAGAGGRGLAGDARRRLPLGGGAGGRGRRLPPLRHALAS